jgi:hypothetical protein
MDLRLTVIPNQKNIKAITILLSFDIFYIGTYPVTFLFLNLPPG